MEFDRLLSREDGSGNIIEYGVVDGNECIVLIKSGKGGTYRGGNDKYLKMARRINLAKGCTVICSSNPIESDDSHFCDAGVINGYVDERRFTDYEIFLFGSSNGGYQNIVSATCLTRVRKMICVNMPLMLNFHKTTAHLLNLDVVEKVFIYGSKDPSFSLVPFLEIKAFPNCRIIRVSGADHNFSGMENDFIELIDLI